MLLLLSEEEDKVCCFQSGGRGLREGGEGAKCCGIRSTFVNSQKRKAGWISACLRTFFYRGKHAAGNFFFVGEESHRQNVYVRAAAGFVKFLSAPPFSLEEFPPPRGTFFKKAGNPLARLCRGSHLSFFKRKWGRERRKGGSQVVLKCAYFFLSSAVLHFVIPSWCPRKKKADKNHQKFSEKILSSLF